ncbi:DUF3247 family protein [Stenotrophomonas sp. Iso1]|uniref:DUF3247 family protein n=1 Tax=Stenotrophomonas sp. Iso1 TaxID=2977283 RepID=UPI0022B789C2|nr:DUF3247 family protein [Stenotrophomonas sp. Iso1]
MAQYAPHVYSDPMTIALLETLAGELPVQARVMLVLDDGARVAGTVTMRPVLQHFADCDECPGVNATVRLDDLVRISQQHMLWLDSVRQVLRLPVAEAP